MSNRVSCPACGKTNRVDDPAAQTILCIACGRRFTVEAMDPEPEPDPAAGVAEESTAAPEEVADDVGDATDVPVLSASQNPQRVVSPHTRGRTMIPGGHYAIVAVACLVIGGIVGVLIYAAASRGKGSKVAGPDEVRDLLALKSEAERLVADGKLEEAHAKYREMAERGIGRKIEDPLNWDIMERAKTDQDRVLTLLMDKAQAAYPPEEVMRPPGPGSTTQADDPWYWPRVGTGGRVSREDQDADPDGQADSDAETDTYANVGADADAVTDADANTGVEAAPTPPPATTESATAALPPPKATTQPQGEPTFDATAAPASAARDQDEPPIAPPWVTDEQVTDAEIGYALSRGVNYLLAQFKDGQLKPMPGMTDVKFAGRNALAVYALLQAGRATNDPRLDPSGTFMRGLIDKMKSHPMERKGDEPAQPVTYARSVRAAALALYNKPQDRDVLKADAQWLIKAHVNGAYTYDDQFTQDAETNRMGASLEWDAPADEWDLPDLASATDSFCDGINDGPGRMNRPFIPRRMAPRSKTRLPTYGRDPIPQAPRTQRPTMGGGGGGNRRTGAPTWSPPIRIAPPTAPQTQGESSYQFPWDNSNSQYGLLGVWAAAEAGVEVPRKYWEAVQSHWETWQFKTGEWGYMSPDRTGYLSMTCGGVASLWVTYDYLVAPKSTSQVGRNPMTPNLAAGMKWLESADNAVNTPIPGKTHYPGYDLFGLERVGLASGLKYFGSHDWYRELAAKSLEAQFENGAWGRDDGHSDGIIETSYQLLFLSHGRHPILMNKLRFTRGQGEKLDGKPVPGYWSNRPRDVANLTRFASRELERSFNWQVVDFERPWHDWLDCPVLFIASHNPSAAGSAEFEKLRMFTEAGGLIFTHADGNSNNFTKWVLEELVAGVFPNRQAEVLREDHPIFTLHYDLKKAVPKLFGVSNGSRLLLVHSPNDLALSWQQRADRTNPTAFRLGVHLFLYACGKADFRNRIDSPYIPPPPEGNEQTIAVARVKYDGDWDPEPGAWRRFANRFAWENAVNVPVTPVDFAALDPAKTPIAHLTGNDTVLFTPEQAAALQKYVDAGGIALIDSCGGSLLFDVSVRDTLLPTAFPNALPQRMPDNHRLITDADDGKPYALRLRRYATETLKVPVPPLEVIQSGKGTVILSRVDITTGLLGTNTLTIVGYDPPFAQALAWNLLEWAGEAKK